MFSIFVLIPTADKTISAEISSSPSFVLMVALTLLPLVFTFVTSALVKTFIPLFVKLLSICFEISSSSTGMILGIYSTRVTSVPMAL